MPYATDFYSAASGKPLYAGMAEPSTGWPAWRTAQAANTWIEIPTANTLADLNPKNNPALNPNPGGNPEWSKSPANFTQIIGAWCGACFDVETDTLWLPLNGGHTDYAGNEPYKIVLNTNAPQFVMVRPPSGAIGNLLVTDDIPVIQAGSTSTQVVLASGGNAPLIYGGTRDEASSVDGAYVGMNLVTASQILPITAYVGATRTATVSTPVSGTVPGQSYGVRNSSGTFVHGREGEKTGRYSDGRPRAIHSYNKPVYVPGVGPAIAVQGNTAWSGNYGTNRPIIINPSSGEMIRFGASYNNMFASKGAACWDPTRSSIWFHHGGTGKMARYDYQADTWTDFGATFAFDGEIGMIYLPGDDCIFVASAFFANGFAIFDCATGTLHQPPKTGALVGGVTMGKFQPQWIPSMGAVAGWDNTSSTTSINIFTKPSNPRTGTWDFSQLPVAPGNSVTPSVRTANGTFGRFAFSPKLNGFIVLNSVAQKPYFFALD